MSILPRRRYKLLAIITIILAIAGMLWYWGRGLGNDKLGIRAGVPPIQPTQEAGYDYEFNASTFKLLMGDDQGDPSFKLKQGQRELGIRVRRQELRSSEVQNDGAGDNLPLNPPNFPLQPLNSPSPTLTPPLNSLTPTLTPPQVDGTSAVVSQLITHSLLSEANYFSFVPLVYAQANPLTTPDPALLDGTDTAVQILNPDTLPVAGYTELNFLLQPNLDGVLLTWQLDSTSDLPSLEIDPQHLQAQYGGEGSVDFQTRTGRKAFKLQNATLLSEQGQEQLPVELKITGRLQADPGGQLGHSYTISITPPADWSSNTQWPQVLQIELISLFHDRMLPVRPVRQDFKSAENLEFTIDLSDFPDPEMLKALENDDLPHMMFGLIDSNAETTKLAPVINNRQSDQLTIALSLSRGTIKPGIFDLLIQYRDHNAYIAETDFSWGILSMNPDMAIYPADTPVQVDFAVLDKMGRMVCDADLNLKIQNSKHKINDELSTENGQIQVTDGCFHRITELPDYTATYQAVGDGIYELTLTAVTTDGQFTINDQFIVDSTSPVYLRRQGPTRIYPYDLYQMQLEVLPNITLADLPSSVNIHELVPGNFVISQTSSPVQITTNDSGQQQITWEASFTSSSINLTPVGQVVPAGLEPITVSYTFDAPDTSPALYLLGPATVTEKTPPVPSPQTGGQSLSLEEGEIGGVYTEPRQWQLAIDDTTGNLFPVADGRDQPSTWLKENGASDLACNTNTCYDAVDETSGSITACTPNANSGTGEEIYTNTVGAAITFDINESSITPNSTITDMAISLCNQRSGTGANCTFETRRCQASGCTNFGTATTCNSSWTETIQTHTGLSITDLTDIEIGVVYSSTARNLHVSRIMVDITYTPPTPTPTPTPAGPNTDQVMRHGNWFSGGVEQSFFWAD